LAAFVDFVGLFLRFTWVSLQVQRVFSAFSATFRATFDLFPRLLLCFCKVRIAAFVAQKSIRFIDFAVPDQRVTDGPPFPRTHPQDARHEPCVVGDRLAPIVDQVDDNGIGPAFFQCQAHCPEHEVSAKPLVPRATVHAAAGVLRSASISTRHRSALSSP